MTAASRTPQPGTSDRTSHDDDSTELVGALAQPADASGADPAPGMRLGAYRLLERVGEGGMGTVFRAEQLEPVRRMVAIKLIRRQLLGGLAEAYFEVERQALAEMDHPAIAKVYDAGRTGDGFPYFAMEWIEGETLDDWKPRVAPSLAARARIMIALARGVHHAHQRGVIHRDLKPSNVLVTEVDGLPQPKIIDFGVAISIGRGDAAHVALSYDRAGTGPYMSPEQTQGDVRGIDIRTDVYSLGVILLWLLLPDDAMTRLLAAGSSRAALHRHLLNSLGALRGERAERAPDAVLTQVPAELRWTIARAIEPEREKRYPSALALAEDLERWLDHRAVLAVPATRAYRMRKFARRHAGALVASAAVLVALLGGFAAALYGLERAEREATRSGAIAGFLANVLSGVDPDRARDLDKGLLRLVLDEAALRARNELGSEREVLVEIEDVIAQSYAGLADSDKALQFARTAHAGAQAAEVSPEARVRIAHHLVDALVDAGKAQEAVELGTTTLAHARSALGETATETQLARVALGWALRERGEYAQAQALTAAAAAGLGASLGPGHDDARTARYYDAILLSDLERFTEAEVQLAELIALATRTEGADHPRTLRMRNSLAVLYLQAKRYPDAERTLEAALPDYERTLGADHTATLSLVGNLGGALREQGKIEESGPHYRRAAEQLAAKLGPEHPRAIMTRHNYGNFLLDAGDAGQALAMQMQAHAHALETFGSSHPVLAEVLEGWGKAATVLGRWDEAKEKLDAALAMKRGIYGDKHRTIENTLAALAALEKARSGRP